MGGTQSTTCQNDDHSSKPSSSDGGATPPRPIIPKNFTLLHGCTSMEEHAQKIAADVAIIKQQGLRGKDALRALGFEFQFVPCNLHQSSCTATTTPTPAAVQRLSPKSSSSSSASSVVSLSSNDESSSYQSSSGSQKTRYYYQSSCHDCATRLFYVGSSTNTTNTNNTTESDDDESSSQSSNTATHNDASSSTMITLSNRKHYIADGAHYDLIANLAQQAAQQIMCSKFNLTWVTVCNDPTLGSTIRAMVDMDHPLLLEEGENRKVLQELLLVRDEKKEDDDDDCCCETTITATTTTTTTTTTNNVTSTNKTKATLLIATGRGKVRAGIFSRQHLLTAGIEIGTAWYFIQEARLRRGWGVAIIDPNARGEQNGFSTFQKSVGRLFLTIEDEDESNNMMSCESTTTKQTMGSGGGGQSSSSIYILAHSAGGGQLVRHLREDSTLLPSIKAIAFTDSSHNVQWCKNQPSLMEFLQQKNCVYVRSNDVRSSQSCVKVSSRGKEIQCGDKSCSCTTQASGKLVNTDQFWEHRFGKIKTLWAGSPDHSLSNYAGRDAIWGHFDEHTEEEAADNKDGLE